MWTLYFIYTWEQEYYMSMYILIKSYYQNSMSKGNIYLKKTSAHFFKIKIYIFSKRDTFAERKHQHFFLYQNTYILFLSLSVHQYFAFFKGFC